jgi:hypothetical protein
MFVRAIVLMITATTVGAAAEPATAASCNKTCAVINRVLADRANAFAHLKGAPTGNLTDEWKSTVTLSGLTCWVSGQKFICQSYFSKTDGDKKLAAVLSAFRKAKPSWKWYGEDVPEAHTVYGGPTKDSFIALIQNLAPPPAAELGRDGYTFNLIVNVAPQPAPAVLKPVLP